MSLNDKLIEASESYDGLSISPGDGDAVRKLKSLVTEGNVNFRVTEYAPWCSIFQCSVVESQGGKSPRSAWAKDWLKVGLKIQPADALPGDICIFTRDKIYGHVTQFRRRDGDILWCYGGNQKHTVKLSPFKVSDLLGIRRVTPRVEAARLADAEPASELDTTPEPAKPIAPAETVKETEQRLRDQGSRTITVADSAQRKSFWATISGVSMSVLLALQSAWEQAAPFVKLFGPYILLILAFIAWEVYRDQKAIKDARISDDRDGVHTGRKPTNQEDDAT